MQRGDNEKKDLHSERGKENQIGDREKNSTERKCEFKGRSDARK